MPRNPRQQDRRDAGVVFRQLALGDMARVGDHTVRVRDGNAAENEAGVFFLFRVCRA
jgi:hypothetical protein